MKSVSAARVFALRTHSRCSRPPSVMMSSRVGDLAAFFALWAK